MNILDELVAKGVSGEVIVAVAKLIAEAQQAEDRRLKNTERMRSVRARAHTQAHTETQKNPNEINGKSALTLVSKKQEQPSDIPVPSPTDLERELFARGKQVLGQSAGGLIAKILKSQSGSVAEARSMIERASVKQNPREYIGRALASIEFHANTKHWTDHL